MFRFQKAAQKVAQYPAESNGTEKKAGGKHRGDQPDSQDVTTSYDPVVKEKK